MMMRTTKQIRFFRWMATATLAGLLIFGSGCASSPDDSNMKKGAMTGAAVGAGFGLLMGVLTGDSDIAATAMVMGATAGAIDVGYEGFKQDQENNRSRELADAIRQSGQAQPSTDPDARAREELSLLPVSL